MRLRNLSWITTLTREFAGRRVMAITHHLTIPATRANFERLSPEAFLHLDKHEKPLNCGVTQYVGDPEVVRRGGCAWWSTTGGTIECFARYSMGRG